MSYINKDSMKSQIAFIIVASILFCCLIPLLPSGQAVESLSPRTSLVVVLDAGHGGVDVKLGQYVFSKKTTYFLDMWLFLIYKHHYRLYTSGLLQIHL